MVAVDEVLAETQKGLAGDPRYHGRSRRQVTLIAREELAEHAAALQCGEIVPGAARANLETTGVSLADWVGRELQVGEAILHIDELRDPCAKMDAVQPGLRARMDHGRQGVLARVVRGGLIRRGDSIGAVASSPGLVKEVGA